jgi:hypothetical protein
MRRFLHTLLFVSLIAVPLTATAFNVGTDVVVPAAAYAPGVGDAFFITDLYIMNPGDAQVSVTLSWLLRGQANPDPVNEVLTVEPGETLVLENVFQSVFGVEEGESAVGAFLVEATGVVVVNSRIYNLQDSTTFGQGFEGVPVADAIMAGDATDVVGLSHNDSFRTNIILMDTTGEGSSVDLSVRMPNGTELASGSFDLDAWEPQQFAVTGIDASLTFDNATLHAEVTSGAAVVVASKVDNASGDPTTLEMWTALGGGGAASVDGTYQFAVYDSAEWASGGNVVIENGEVTAINITYFNWDKDDDGDLIPDCPIIFLGGGPLTPPVPVEDFAQGVSWGPDPFPDSGEITWTVQFTVSDNMSISGTVDAVGANFPSEPEDQTGCDGTFPPLDLLGGKIE